MLHEDQKTMLGPRESQPKKCALSFTNYSHEGREVDEVVYESEKMLWRKRRECTMN
jgi:hypothetical protein